MEEEDQESEQRDGGGLSWSRHGCRAAYWKGFFYVKGQVERRDYKEAEARGRDTEAFSGQARMDSNSVHAPPLMVVDMEKPMAVH